MGTRAKANTVHLTEFLATDYADLADFNPFNPRNPWLRKFMKIDIRVSRGYHSAKRLGSKVEVWNATASELCSRSFGRLAAGFVRRIRASLGSRPIRHVEAGHVEGDHHKGQLDESPYLRFSRRERGGRKRDAMAFGDAADGDDAQSR